MDWEWTVTRLESEAKVRAMVIIQKEAKEHL